MKNVRESSSLQRDRRIPYRGMVVIHPAVSGERISGEVWDLSTGGMFIRTSQPLEAGSVFNVEIPMQPLSFRGAVRVLRTRLSETGPEEPCGMGVEFVDLTTNQKRLMLRQVDEYLRAGGDLLVGTPEAKPKEGPAARKKTTSKAEAPSHTRLIIELSIAAILLLVVLALLLGGWR